MYYGERSYEGSGFKPGDVCVALDRYSIPGNGIIKPVTNINGVQSGEYDGDYASTFKLTLSDHTRTIEGTVWEDIKEAGKIIGNGKLDANERKIKGVKVELIDESGNVVDTYSLVNDIEINENTEKVALKTTKKGKAEDISGEQDGKYSISGIIPGEYKLRYTYADGTTQILGLNEFKVRNYKSTVLYGASGEALKGNNINWIRINEDRFNDAADDLELRDKIDSTNIISF